MKLGNKLKKIIKIDAESYELELLFADGFKGTVNLGFIFGKPQKKPLVLEILRGNLFQKCFIESGSLAWSNGFELCPDTIRSWIGNDKKAKDKAAKNIVMSPGEMVKTLRELKGWYQMDLARKTGISQTNLSAIENERVQIGKDRAIVLAKVLNVHPAAIMFADYEYDLSA